MLSEPLITLMFVIGFDLALVGGRDTKKPVLSKDGAHCCTLWASRYHLCCRRLLCGGLSMTLGNGRIPTALSCRFVCVGFGAVALGRLLGLTLPTFQLMSALY